MSIYSLVKKFFVNEKLLIHISKRNYYAKKRVYYIKKEEEQKNYKRDLEESYLIDSIEEEKRKQLIEKETIILYTMQKIKEIQDGISVTPEQIQQLIKNLETTMDTLKTIINSIDDPRLKELFEISFNLIKKFNNQLKNNKIILTENNYMEIEEKSLKLKSKIENFHNYDRPDELIEAVYNLINAIYRIVETISHNQERTSLHQKFEGLRSKAFEPVPPMEEKTFVKTFASGEIPPQEFESEDMQRKNS